MHRFLLAFSVLTVSCVTKPSSNSFCDEGRAPSSAMSCEDLFASKPQPQINLSHSYDSKTVEELRVNETSNGQYLAVRRTSYYLYSNREGLTSVIWEPVIKRPSGTEDNSEVNKLISRNNNVWQKDKREAIEFVLQQYAERREHWPEEFRNKLRNMADEELANSTYITIRSQKYSTRNTFKEKSILGTLRLIEERNGKLPMENYLGITINSHGAKKFEPGNFGIDRSVNQYTFGEILLHLIETILDKSQQQETHYYTYADRQSLVMYKILGFKPIDPKDMTLAPDVKLDEKGRITKNDVSWTPLQTSRVELEDLLNLFLVGGLPNHVTPEVQEVMKHRYEAMKAGDIRDHLDFAGRVKHSDGRSNGCLISIRNKDDMKLIEFGDFSKEHMFRGWDPIQIPNRPLEEGFHQEESAYGYIRTVDYNHGVLTFRRVNSQGKIDAFYTLRTTPDLSTVEYLRVDLHQAEDFHSSFEAWF